MYSKMLGALHAKNWDWFYSFICVHGTQMTALWHWWRSRLEWPNIFILDDWRRLCVLPHLLQPISSTNTKRRRAPSTHESIRKKAMKFSNYWLMGLSIFHWCPISMNAKSPVSDHYRWSIHLLRAALESFQKSDTALIKLDMLVKKIILFGLRFISICRYYFFLLMLIRDFTTCRS